MERNERYQSATEYRPRTARPAAASGRSSGTTRAAEEVMIARDILVAEAEGKRI